MGQRDETPRFGNRPAEGLFTDHTLQFGAGFYGGDNLFHDRNAREVRRIDGNAIDMLCHLRDAVINDGVPDAEAPRQRCQFGRPLQGRDTGQFHATDLLHCDHLKAGDKAGPDRTDPQGV